MNFPRLPDWTIYAAVVLALLIASVGRREKADAPAPPPPVPGEDGVPLGPASPFDPAVVVEVQDDKPQPSSGTAFSIAAKNVSEVPSEMTMVPGAVAPMPTSDDGLSPVERTTWQLLEKPYLWMK